jgi:pimeloyl-ACP methyl ester carboxylesterase
MERGTKMKHKIIAAIMLIIHALLFSSCTITLHESNFFFPKTYEKIPDYVSGNFSMENINFSPEKSVDLSGVILRSKGSKDFILYFYGNGSNIVNSFPRLKFLNEHYRLNVVCFDYRSYGYSTGTAGFKNIMSDGLAIYDHVLKNYAGGGKIFIYTQSVGTPVGLEIACNRETAGIIMEAGFTRGADAVAHMTDGQQGIEKFFVHLKADDYLANYPDPPVEKIKRVKVPLLYVLGTEDEVFPFAMGKELFDAAGSKDKTFCPIYGKRHSNLDITEGKYLEETEKFFKARGI